MDTINILFYEIFNLVAEFHDVANSEGHRIAIPSHSLCGSVWLRPKLRDVGSSYVTCTFGRK